MRSHLGYGPKLKKDLEETVLVLLAHRPGCVNQILGHQKNPFEHLWVFIVKKVAADNEIDQLIHKTVKLVRVTLCAVMDHCREGRQSRAHEVGHISALAIGQVLYHHRKKEVCLHVEPE